MSVLRHSHGNPCPVVRIEFDKGILRASICVKPHRPDDAAVFVPGFGPCEFVATSVDHEVLALRDLNRERIAQERIWLNMRAFDGFYDGEDGSSTLADCGFGACLADDMGFGKTIQLIAVLLDRAPNGASLVIAPAVACPAANR